MALFASLSERLNHIFSKLTKRGKLTELEIRQAMREVRIALLEADVNLRVAKDFIAQVSEKAVGQQVLESLNPAQQVIKIVNEELIALMGPSNAKLEVSPKPPTVIMMCGLQGAGKTTMCAKLAVQLKKQGKRPLLVAGDIYRPAAIDQLKVVGGKAGAARRIPSRRHGRRSNTRTRWASIPSSSTRRAASTSTRSSCRSSKISSGRWRSPRSSSR